MPHIVEVRHIGSDHGSAAAELQFWLDRHRIRPAAFERSIGGPGITFRVHFTAKDEAIAFAETFRGRLNDGCPSDQTNHWEISALPACPHE